MFQNKINRKYDLAIFDLDGTLLNTIEDLADSVNTALQEYGLPVRTLAEVTSFVGNGMRLLIERSVPAGTNEQITQQVLDRFHAIYKEHYMDKTVPYAGIPETLQQLQDAGYKLAVVSNKGDYGVQALCSQFFAGIFDIAMGDTEGVARKPAPDIVFFVMDRLQVLPVRSVYIGDSPVDIETAANAGIACISVDWGFRSRKVLEEAGAANIASTPAELAALLVS